MSERVPAIAFAFLLLGGWEAMAVSTRNPLVPRLAEIGAEFARILARGIFLAQMAATLERVLLGFALAFVIAVALGIPAGRHARVRAFIEPGIQLGLTVPGLVWALLSVIWFGVSLWGAVAAIALSVTPALILNVAEGTRAAGAEYVDVARVFGFRAFDRLRLLWLPLLTPYLLAGARLGLSLAWKVIVLVEVFGLSSGIGYQLNSEFSAQNVAGVLAWTLSFCAVMVAIEVFALRALERRLLRWRRPG